MIKRAKTWKIYNKNIHEIINIGTPILFLPHFVLKVLISNSHLKKLSRKV